MLIIEVNVKKYHFSGYDLCITGMEECEGPLCPGKISQENRKNSSYDKQVQEIQRYEEAHLNPKYTFDTFIVGSNNKFCQAHPSSCGISGRYL